MLHSVLQYAYPPKKAELLFFPIIIQLEKNYDANRLPLENFENCIAQKVTIRHFIKVTQVKRSIRVFFKKK